MTTEQAGGELDEYRLLRLLGSGAMGEVYLGHDVVLDRPVAIKFLRAPAPDRIARERFLIEARAIARLQHPNVVTLYRVGEARGRPYLVSELVRGRSLDLVPRPLPKEQLLKVALGLARGLAAAHRRGVLHRDIKPANAILAEDGEVKLLDFGLAKLQGEPAEAPGGDGIRRFQARSSFESSNTVPSQAPSEADGLADTADLGPAEVPPTAAARPADVSSRAAPRGVAETADLESPPSAGAAGAMAAASPAPLSSAAVTQPGAILGTPRYLAPELWLGEAATLRSDVYSLGALLFELCAGGPPYPQDTIGELRRAVLAEDAPPLGQAAPGADPRLCAVVDRCLRRDPAERFGSGEELSRALDALDRAGRGEPAVPAGNPYRGLYPFDAEHRGLFFGRSLEIGHLLERLRAEPLLVVSGDSGVGKSSLCAAGLLPLVTAGALGEGRTWATLRLAPGRRPLLGLLEALLPGWLPAEADPAAWLEGRADAPARALRQRIGAAQGVVLFIDQVEELLTQSDAREAALCAEVVAHLADRAPGVRVLLTARGDFLSRLAGLPLLGPALGRAVHVLGPLSREDLREVIVGPAQATGVRFASDEMVETLIETALAAQGGLPLLEFALAELWAARDAERGVIPAEALEAIGGVGGALARHADAVLGRLLPAEREVARRMLLRLVTAQGTGARRSIEELAAGPGEHAVLDALVTGRLVCAHDGATYTLAHEALLRGWATLRGWLERDGERQAVRQRLGAAAAEWQRLGRPREALLGRQQLREVQATGLLAADLAPREAELLAASRAEARRRLFARGALVVAVPLVLLGAYAAQALSARASREARVAAQLRRADQALAQARSLRAEATARRQASLRRFDDGDVAGGEQDWEGVLRTGQGARAAYKEAGAALETALLLDGADRRLRRRYAEALSEQAGLADEEHRQEQRDDLLARLAPYDEDGALRRALAAPARLRLRLQPADARVTLWRYAQRGLARELERPGDLGAATERDGDARVLRLPPGSYRLDLEAPGRAPARYPVLLAPGEALEAEVALPPAGRVPPGLVYVPRGRSLFGSADDENWRRTGITAQPLHAVWTGPYLIGRSEVTLGEWLDFLRGLPEDERRRRRPHAGPAPASIDLLWSGDGIRRFQVGPNLKSSNTVPASEFTLLFSRPGQPPQRAGPGEPLRFPVRKQRAAQDWHRLPVTGISWEDALAYAAWLDRTGRVPGARLCTEHEWERGARGADDRRYPHGDDLGEDDANHDVTYGRHPLAFGPDEVGSHPRSESPFGLQDMAGNAWEWTKSVNRAEPIIYRGGGWYEGRISSQSINRSAGEAGLRHITMGLRICASID